MTALQATPEEVASKVRQRTMREELKNLIGKEVVVAIPTKLDCANIVGRLVQEYDKRHNKYLYSVRTFGPEQSKVMITACISFMAEMVDVIVEVAGETVIKLK